LVVFGDVGDAGGRDGEGVTPEASRIGIVMAHGRGIARRKLVDATDDGHHNGRVVTEQPTDVRGDVGRVIGGRTVRILMGFIVVPDLVHRHAIGKLAARYLRSLLFFSLIAEPEHRGSPPIFGAPLNRAEKTDF
jgi:hypothetical protein